MRGVERTVYLLFNDVSKITIATQKIQAHKAIYNCFGSGIFHKPHSILKPKSYELHNMNIGLFSGNYTRMAGYFYGNSQRLAHEKSTPYQNVIIIIYYYDHQF